MLPTSLKVAVCIRIFALYSCSKYTAYRPLNQENVLLPIHRSAVIPFREGLAICQATDAVLISGGERTSLSSHTLPKLIQASDEISLGANSRVVISNNVMCSETVLLNHAGSYYFEPSPMTLH